MAPSRTVNALDVAVLVVLVSAAVGGHRVGFIARGASWLGLLVGLLVAGRTLPALVRLFAGDDEGAAFGIAAGVLAAGAFAGQSLGLLVGGRARRSLRHHPLAGVDRLVGAGAGAVGVLVVAWLLLPPLSELGGWPAAQAESSGVRRALDGALPDPPDAMAALRTVVGEEGFPLVVVADDATVDGPPPTGDGLGAAVVETVRASVVRVESGACERIQDGTGFAVGTELVLTNAHVVAGAGRVEVSAGDGGDDLVATVVAFDPARDLALLTVPGLPGGGLPLREAAEGEVGGVFGHPAGGPLEVSPARVDAIVAATGRDLYGRDATRREVLFLAAELAPGDSGGPLVAPGGEVIGIAFAVSPDEPQESYAISAPEIRAFLADSDAGTPAETGACLADR